ncbi:GH1 family beta-glucosidase [Actinacidiphila oryziradicis]|uniref:GH1 family beta-glucosidase n=1 Tax=Actinacidiphila oryziradicis TaxID=2571141 RepID=UPI0023F2C451|nr:GH1 family beta-glucosidase [Actinacidiphila oryziradicis]MCW2870743.1 beta-glucosidase [Actinacidiphila oryziradicis]
MNDLSALPAEFLWGAATAAYQIEGAVAEDGRAPSIWDTFSHTPGKTAGGDTGDTACDHYHRWPEDIGIMRELGLDAYRFSIAWPRVLPQGDGPVNAPGLAFYDRLVDGLLEAGITPYPTLYHWDLPQALQDRGGWPARETALRFGEYAAVVAEALGDRVTDWATLNEPLCSAWIGHLDGVMAPGLTDLTAAVRASYHLHLGHGLAVQAIRAANPHARVGIVNNLSPSEPATDRPEDHAAALRADGHVNRWWLDPIHGRGYPQDMLDLYGVDLPVRAGDLETIAVPLDWLGVNYYFRDVVADHPTGGAPYTRQVPTPGAHLTAMGWEVHADGLEQLLVRLTEEYGARRLIVTENGSAYRDTVGPDGQVHDPERSAYLEEHLAACARAVRRGAPLAGYFAWSLLDNFEWAYGYDKRFGLVHVDYPTQKRTVKGSGRRYADIIAAHRLRAQRAA